MVTFLFSSFGVTYVTVQVMLSVVLQDKGFSSPPLFSSNFTSEISNSSTFSVKVNVSGTSTPPAKGVLAVVDIVSSGTVAASTSYVVVFSV